MGQGVVWANAFRASSPHRKAPPLSGRRVSRHNRCGRRTCNECSGYSRICVTLENQGGTTGNPISSLTTRWGFVFTKTLGACSMTFSPVMPQVRTDIKPTRDDVRRLFEQGDLVLVYRTLLADLETPVSVYLKLAQTGMVSFLLESVEGGEQVGRYSFLGVNPKGVITVKDGVVTRTLHGETTTRPLAEGEDPLDPIKREFQRVKPVRLSGLPRFVGGAVGFISYDFVRYVERLPETARKVLEVPETAFMLVDTLVIFDHAKHQLLVL